MIDLRQPSPKVLESFGARDPAVPMAGGQGVTWRSGALVLKPTADSELATWCAELLSSVRTGADLRIARPLPAAEGWVVDGWTGWQWQAGEPADHRLADIVAAGASFHRALGEVPRPDILDQRDDPWRRADRIAWGEDALPGDGLFVVPLRRLAAIRRPVVAAAQLIHPDLAGNVLFAADAPPCVIDWPPYWRPPTWATAIVAIDGLDAGRVDTAATLDLVAGRDWLQFLIRAEMFRLATKNVAAAQGVRLVDDKTRHLTTVDWLCTISAASEPEAK